MSVAHPLDATIGSLSLFVLLHAYVPKYSLSLPPKSYLIQVIRETSGGFGFSFSYVMEFHHTHRMRVPPQVAVAFILNNVAMVLVMHTGMFSSLNLC
jgi:hypothetical protein